MFIFEFMACGIIAVLILCVLVLGARFIEEMFESDDPWK